MSLNLTKKSILKKTAQVSLLTFSSRILGIMREFLLMRFLDFGVASDAFITAFKIPNFFRHIFAEGALSASFVPAIVKKVKEGNRQEANGLMTISFLVFEGVILLMYLFVLAKTQLVLTVIAPGFSAEQISAAIPLLRVMFVFLLFVSSCALFAGALNSVNHFFVPALGTPLWNVFVIGTLILCLFLKLPIIYLCAGIIVGAFMPLVLHFFMYKWHDFQFGRIDAGAIASFKGVLKRFLPCLLGVSIVELNLFSSSIIASFFPKGTVTLLYYGGRFMHIPLGVFAVAFSSIMLPHFSRIVLYAPKRLNFYVLEVAKFVTWVILPAMFFLSFVSYPLFSLLLKKKVVPALMMKGSWILVFYSAGLLFLCMNKVLMSIFYSLKDTWATTIASIICAVANIVGDLIALVFYSPYGIAIANSCAGLLMTIICFILLQRRHGVLFYGKTYLSFAWRYLIHLAVGLFLFLGSFYALLMFLGRFIPQSFLQPGGLIYWFLVLSLFVLMMGFLFVMLRRCRLNVYFLK